MVKSVQMVVTKDTATPFLKGLPTKVETAKNVSGWNMARRGTKFLRMSARRAGIQDFRGNLLGPNGMRAKKVNKNTWGIFIPRKGVMLDGMRPHIVALKRGRIITQWAREKGIKGKAIRVHPHPFIEAGWRSLLNSIPSELEEMVNKIVR